MDRTERKLLQILKRRGQASLSAEELLSHFRPGRERKAAMRRLARLVSKGKVLKGPDGAFLASTARMRIQGRFEPINERYAFVIPLSPGVEDVYVPAQHWLGAIDGDIVDVVFTHKKGRRSRGRIIRIVKRTRSHIVGKVFRNENGTFIDPLSAKLFHSVIVISDETGKAADGLIVSAKIDRIDERAGRILVSITEVWGRPDDPEVITKIIIDRYNIPTEFSEEAIAQARRLRQEVTQEDLLGRVDHRGLITFTIDGEQAKDFDDAVSIERVKDGFRLFVHIADVANYVTEGSALDQDAYERATSVYFPGSVIPMLPFELSNEICSLKPNEERLALTVRMDFDRKGKMRGSKIYESVIRSNARLTYTEVARLLEQRGQQGSSVGGEKVWGLADDLFAMDDLAKLLTKRRMERGSLDFDLPEPLVILNLRGKPEDVVKEQRNPAHRLIEEFMIAANETVASFLVRSGSPCVFRVHEPPDDESLIALGRTVKALGMKTALSDGNVSERLQHLIEHVRGKRIERLVSYLVLRALKIATYSPENVGHFGLASDCYAHFTSPIRRYPDLIVHRFVKQRVSSKSKRLRVGLKGDALTEAAHHCSIRERAAEGAERQIVKMRQAEFMADKVGQVFTGIISGVIGKGFFVELDEFFVEGFVPVSSLTEERFSFTEEKLCLTGLSSGRQFRIGDPVKVRVRSVQLARGQIDFALVDQPQRIGQRQKGRKARSRTPARPRR